MKECDWHKPHGLGYINWVNWANDQTTKGEKQKQCPDCELWFFPSQYGEKPNRRTTQESKK